MFEGELGIRLTVIAGDRGETCLLLEVEAHPFPQGGLDRTGCPLPSDTPRWNRLFFPSEHLLWVRITSLCASLIRACLLDLTQSPVREGILAFSLVSGFSSSGLHLTHSR